MADRKILVAGNWKMNTIASEASDLTKGIIDEISNFGQTEVLICPPFVWLGPVAIIVTGTNIRIGAQNMHWEDKGAYTGEISAAMLQSVGCEYVIIGHSERRQYFGETDETINKKLNRAIDTCLTPIICLGETLEQRETDKTDEIIIGQFEKCFEGFSEFNKVVIAYEPIWAIGTGKSATPDQAQQVHRLLRDLLRKQTGDFDKIRLLYGGSVKPDNASVLISKEDIDGFLVGGASLKAADFVDIIKATI